jgi:arsenate reductase
MLTQDMADSADRVITMGCGVDASACPARILVSEDWGLDDPKDQPVDKVCEIRDQIRERVGRLLDDITSEGARS